MNIASLKNGFPFLGGRIMTCKISGKIVPCRSVNRFRNNINNNNYLESIMQSSHRHQCDVYCAELPENHSLSFQSPKKDEYFRFESHLSTRRMGNFIEMLKDNKKLNRICAIQQKKKVKVLENSLPSMMKLMLLGPPGVGKGTFAKRLSKHWSIPTICTGDIIRKEIHGKTELGLSIASQIASGDLLSDNLVVDLTLNHLKNESHFILDGFPRTIGQAKALSSKHVLNCVIRLVLPDDILVNKMLARRICSNSSCNACYNIANIRHHDIVMEPLLPRVTGICDHCNSELKERTDDREEVIRHRLELYHKETHPLVEFYENKGILINFYIKRGIEDWTLLENEISKMIRSKFYD